MQNILKTLIELLKKYFPNLEKLDDFIEKSEYLGGIKFDSKLEKELL